MRNEGHTLVELLVVTTIISILLALMLPSLIVAKGEAKKTICRLQRKAVTRYDEQAEIIRFGLPVPVLTRCYECHIPNRYRQPIVP